MSDLQFEIVTRAGDTADITWQVSAPAPGWQSASVGDFYRATLPKDSRKAPKIIVTDFKEKELVRESEWLRVYTLDNGNTYVYESKMLVDGLQPSFQEIKDKWPSMPLDEKLEFASAFRCQPPRPGDDQLILTFLMDTGPVEVWDTVAVIASFHPDPHRGLAFLLDGVRRGGAARSEYYQGLELMRDVTAIPILLKQFDEHRSSLAKQLGAKEQIILWGDYVQCCKTLWTLTRDRTFLAVLEEGPASVPAQLRSFASSLLSDALGGGADIDS